MTKEGIHKISSFLGLISGGLISALGVWVLIKSRKGEDLHANCCGQHHDHDSNHDNHVNHNNHGHVSKSNLITSGLIGVATGMTPCPTVIVAYLSGISTGNTLLGVQSVSYFALGMFIALMTVVIAFNLGGQKIEDKLKGGKLSRFNWGYIQGSLFVGIGVFTALIH